MPENMISINYADIVCKMLKDEGAVFDCETVDDGVLLTMPISLRCTPRVNWRIHIRRDGYVGIECLLGKAVQATNRADILHNLNELHGWHSFVRLTLDENNDIIASYEYHVMGDIHTAGEHFMDVCGRLREIMSECHESLLEYTLDKGDHEAGRPVKVTRIIG